MLTLKGLQRRDGEGNVLTVSEEWLHERNRLPHTRAQTILAAQAETPQ
jgi:hypothetical protein